MIADYFSRNYGIMKLDTFLIAKMLWSMYSLAVNNRCGSFISQPNLQCQFLAAVFITAGNVEAAKRLV